MVCEWLGVDLNQTAEELRESFKKDGVEVSESAVKKLSKESARKWQ
jgi:hypothetical protein